MLLATSRQEGRDVLDAGFVLGSHWKTWQHLTAQNWRAYSKCGQFTRTKVRIQEVMAVNDGSRRYSSS